MAAPRASIVFDFDGTLVDSARGILNALQAVLEKHAITPKMGLHREIIGPPLMQTLQYVSGLSDPSALSVLAADFKHAYDGDGYLDTDPFPGIEAALGALQQAGLELHVATNKRGTPTRKVLDHLGWRGYFKSVYCLDECSGCHDKAAMIARLLTEQGLAASHSLYIGDTPADASAAAANALPFLAVAWGYGSHWKDGIRICRAPAQLATHVITALGMDASCHAS